MSYRQPFSYPKVNRARCGPVARHANAVGSRLVAAGSGPNIPGFKPKQFTITDVVSRNMKDARYSQNRLKTLTAARRVMDYKPADPSSYPPNLSVLQSKVTSKKPAPTSGSFQELCDIVKNYQDRGYRASKYAEESETQFSPRPTSKPSLLCKGIKLDPIISEPCSVSEQQLEELYMSYSDIDIKPYNVMTDNQVSSVLHEDNASTIPPLQLPTTVSDDAPPSSDRCSIVNLSFPEPSTQRQSRSDKAEVNTNSYLSHHISKKQKVKSTSSKRNGRDKNVSEKGMQSVSIPSSNRLNTYNLEAATNNRNVQQSSADRKPPQPLNIGVCQGSIDLKKRKPSKGKDLLPSGYRKPLIPPSNHHSSNDSICLPPIVKKKSEPEGSAVDKGGRSKAARGRGYSAKPVPSNTPRVIEEKQSINNGQLTPEPTSFYNHEDLQQKDSRAAGSRIRRYGGCGIDSNGLLSVSSATIHTICEKSAPPSYTMVKPMQPTTQLVEPKKGSLLRRPKANNVLPYAELMLVRNKSSQLRKW